MKQFIAHFIFCRRYFGVIRGQPSLRPPQHVHNKKRHQLTQLTSHYYKFRNNVHKYRILEIELFMMHYRQHALYCRVQRLEMNRYEKESYETEMKVVGLTYCCYAFPSSESEKEIHTNFSEYDSDNDLRVIILKSLHSLSQYCYIILWTSDSKPSALPVTWI